MGAYQSYYGIKTPTPYTPQEMKAQKAAAQPKAVPAKAPTPSAGPTGFWGRITQVGTAAATEAAHAAKTTAHAGAATGRFLVGGTAKLANQGVQEAKQVGHTAKMLTASATKNPEAFAHANQQSQKDYKSFQKGKGGLLNVGTLTTEKEAKSGDLKTGVKKIGGGVLSSAAELVPVGKLSKAGKVFKAVDHAATGTAAKIAAKEVGKQAAVGVAAGAAGSVGGQLVANGKVSAKEVAKSAAVGAIMGGGSAAAMKGAKFAITKGKMVFDRSPTKTAPEISAKPEAIDSITASKKIPVTDQSTGAVKGKVQAVIPDKVAPTPAKRPADTGYSDADFRLQFNKGAKDFTVAPGKSGSAVTASQLKTGSKDPLSLTVDALAATKNKSVARAAVDKLLPDVDSTTRNVVTKDITKASSHQEVSDILWNASKDHEARLAMPGSPMSTKVSFEGPVAKEQKVSELGGSRPDNALQTQIEKAHAAGDKATEAKLVAQLKDPAEAPGASLTPERRAQLLAAQKAPITSTAKPSAAAVGDETNSATFNATKPSVSQEINRKGVKGPELKNGEKERGFNETVRRSSNTPSGTKEELAKKDGYVPQKNDVLVEEANHRVAKDINEAHAFAEKDTSNRGVATGVALIHHYQGQGNYKAAADVADSLAQKLIEAGRTIQAAALYNRLSPAGIVQYANRKVSEAGRQLSGDAKEKLQKIAQDIEKMEPGEDKARATQKMLEFIGKQRGSSLGDKTIAVWKAGLLTAPTTTAGNILGNTGSRILARATDPVAVVYDKIFSTIGKTGKLLRVVNKDSKFGDRTVVSSGKGYRGGFTEGLQKGVNYFKTGYDPRHDPTKFDFKQVYFSDTAKGKVAEKYVQGVMRLMGAQDQPFYYGALRNAVQKQGILAAKNQHLHGSVRREFVKEFVQNPSIETMKVANREAKYAVFQNETILGKAVSNLKKGRVTVDGKEKNIAPFTEGVIPFSQVPSSIATRIVEYTPLNAATQLVKQIHAKNFDQKALSEALAKGTVGAGVVGAGVALAKNGNISLGYPKDPATQAQWKAEGKTPYSIKVGDKWVSMNYVQPVGALLAMGGAYQEARNEGKGATDAWNAMFGTVANSITSQSFLQGVSGTLNAATDPERYASKFMNQTAGSLVPNIVRSAARSTDENARKTDTPLDAIKSGIPGKVRKSLPVQTDALGRTVKRPSSAANTFLNPLRPSTVHETPVTKELDRLKYYPGAASKTQRGKLLNTQQYEKFNQTAARRFSDKMERALNDHSYQVLSDNRKHAVIEAAVRDSREEVAKQMFGKKPKVKRQKLLHYR